MVHHDARASWRWIAIGAGVAALLAASRQAPLGPLPFGLGYVIGTLAFVPGSLQTIAAGATFGVVWGSGLALVSATLGASLAFLVARHLGREFFRRHLPAGGRLAALDSAIGKEDLKVVALLRLSPIVPFNLGNDLFWLTRARFGAYVPPSFAGMAPGAVLHA